MMPSTNIRVGYLRASGRVKSNAIEAQLEAPSDAN
jgi:hypothetical protein